MERTNWTKKRARELAYVQDNSGVNIHLVDPLALSSNMWKAVVVQKQDAYDFCIANHVDQRKFNKYIKWFYDRVMFYQGKAPKTPSMLSGKSKIKSIAPTMPQPSGSAFLDEVFSRLLKVYNLSLQYGAENRILAMSIRSFKNCFALAEYKINKWGMSVNDAVFEALDSDYIFASQANMNPSFMNTYLSILREVSIIEPTGNPVKKSADPFLRFRKSLLGMDLVYRRIYDCIMAGTKGVVLSGFHGLGKTTFFYDMARFFECKEVFRVQISQTTNDSHLVGAMHPTEGFIKGIIVKAIETAQEDPMNKYMLLLDEYTRGQDEATQIILPLLAERKLIVNDAYAKMYLSINVPRNLLICATGNVQDAGVRQLGGAESDRWNGQHIKHITDEAILKKLIQPSGAGQ